MTQETADELFFKSQLRDQIKNKYCEENNICLLRIPYFQFGNLEEIISNLVVYLDSR